MPKVKSGRYQAAYSVHKQGCVPWPSLALPNYWQEDYHSCGFNAALTVARYFNSKVPDKWVLDAIRPRLNSGTDNERMMRGLAMLGIGTRYREDMDQSSLYGLLAMGLPVIVTVWPDGWAGDHWTVVRAMSARRVHLTNHYSMSVEDFQYEWIEAWEEGDCGAGIICTKGR